MKKKIKKGLNALKKVFTHRGNNICPICNSKGPFLTISDGFLQNYKTYDLDYDLSDFETLNIKNYCCKNCGATDRDRLMALYFKKEFKHENCKNKSLLDFAPSKPLLKLLSNFNFMYRSADLYMDNVDDCVDIRDMSLYKDSSFDVFICSHILEHIDKDLKAMQELYRITKVGGVGLCLVPIPLSLDKSIENKEYLKSVAMRWKYFGQDDHVRMYSKNDFVKRLSSVGFSVNQLGIDYFGMKTFEKHGIDYKSVLYIVKK